MGNCFARKPDTKTLGRGEIKTTDEKESHNTVTFTYNPPPTPFPTTPAKSTDWNIKSFIKAECHTWHPPLHLNGTQLGRVRRGFVPKEMEDRWFIWSSPLLELESSEAEKPAPGVRGDGDEKEGSRGSKDGVVKERETCGKEKQVSEEKWSVRTLEELQMEMEAREGKKEEVVIHFHRSWTGYEVLAITVELDPFTYPAPSGEEQKSGEANVKDSKLEGTGSMGEKREERGGTVVEVMWESNSKQGGGVVAEMEEAKRMVIGICEGILEVQMMHP